MERAGVVAAEALLVSVAQRYLIGRFQRVHVTRGEGAVLFAFDHSAVNDDVKVLGECVERMLVTIVKELTGRTKLALGDETVDFSDVGAKSTDAKTFKAFMERSASTIGAGSLELTQLPPHPAVGEMLEVLYTEAAADVKGAETVKDFPKHLCAEGIRYDYLLKKHVMVKAFSKNSTPLLPNEADAMLGAVGGLNESVMLANAGNDTSLNAAGTVVFSGECCKILLEAHELAKVLAIHSSAPIEENLPQQWRNKTFSLDEAPEVLRSVYNRMVDFWRNNTHTDRLKVNAISLLQIVTGDVRSFTTERILLESTDYAGPWRMEFSVMEKCAKLCATWRQYLLDLVEKDWVDWDGGHFRDDGFEHYADRLKTAVRIRGLFEAAEQLMNNNATVLYEIRPDVVFDGKSVVDTRQCNRDSWRKSCELWEQRFALVETALAGQVKGLLGSAPQGDARSRIMQQFNVLMRRDAVRTAVEGDIATAYASLQDAMRSAQSKFATEKAAVTEGDAQQMLLVTRRCMAEVGPAVDTSRAIFHPNSDQYKSVEDLAAKISAEVVEAERASVTQWIQTIEGRCSKIAGLEAAITVEVASDGCFLSSKISAVVQTLYNDVLRIRGSLVGPKPSVRVQFSTGTQRTLDDAEKLLKYHMRTSRLIAAFNGAVDQILPVTREMLHEVVEKCVMVMIPQGKNSRMLGFGQGADLDNLNAKFQAAAEAMSAENRSIRRAHARFTDTVNDLFSVDLLRNPDQWKATLKEMRDDFDGFEKRQPNPKAINKWRRHWDHQLYKALEHQYQKGLESLDQNMQEFNVEMIFKQGQVQLKPGYEALREAYYAKLREFVNIPQRFKGVGNSEIFAIMPATNAAGITAVHQKAMELFNKIAKVRRSFRDLVIVGVCGTNGAPDLGTIVDAATSKIEDWEDGYKLIKERMKRLNYVEDMIKVDCVNISTAPIKATIADHLLKLEGSLTHALRRTMQGRLAHIDDFVLFASNIIERQPTTLDEVGKANQAYNKFKDLVPQYQAQLGEVDKMNQMVKQHAGASFEMGVTRSRWEHLMDAMSSHHEQIDSSVKKMRVSVDGMIAKYLKDLQRFADKWNKNKPQGMDAFKSRQDFVDKGLKYVKDQHTELQEYVTNGKELLAKCDYFRMSAPDFSLLEETEADVNTHQQMWSLFEQFEEELDKLRKEDWLTYRSRTYSFEELLKEWREKVAQHVEEKGKGQENLVTKHITTLIDEWSVAVPFLKFVRGDGMLPEHWAEMFRYLGIEKGMTSDKLTFGDILAKHANLVKHEVDLKGLHARAQGEVQIRDAIQELRTWAMEATFTLIMPQDSTNKVQLITEWKDVMTQVSDNQALIGSLKDSPFFPRFADEASGWEAKLVAVAEYLVLLNSIQRKWTYLEPLFARGALPHEQPRFKRVDKEFVSILRDVEADPRIMTLAQHTDYSDKLKNILEQIERCQKALSEFLEQKRDKFPRFYFISDDDLLEILGQSKNPTVIQSHLKKLFAGINSVQFDEHKNAITHMVSADGEVVPLFEKVMITDNNVEDWLIRLDDCMRVTLRDLLAKCVADKDATQMAALEKYPSQILQMCEQIFFAQDAEAALPTGGLAAVGEKLKGKLRHLTGLNLHGKPVIELKTKALILDVIHNIEVVDLLIEKGVRDTASWWWSKQLRYYVDHTKSNDNISREGCGCVLRMVDTEFKYTFEYQGNALKLVHTPLTDKCYLVLTKGMHLGYGGNPYGPAGTGKTESVKALGSAMGRQVLVFNCDEGIDFKAMGRIFVGIVKCGAWGCFDEFNRLKVDQLSAISQMIQAIQETLKNGEPSCALLGRTIDINPNSGIFVTLNPAGKGYGGRTKLPDNLKQLFRAVAMSVPDNELITSTMLQSEGFLFARQISKKVVDVYALSKQLMSAQQHYDWGLRPLKAVLRLGGTLLQQFRHANPEAKTTEEQECEFMVQSLRINTISKLTFDDGRLFNGLIADIFPKIAIKEISYKELEVAIEAAAKALGLQHIASQVHKVLQLYESMNQRMGVVLVGPSGSGKSTLLRILRKALQIMNVTVPMHVVNPKALPRQQLLGHMDPDTREWFDGVLSAAARKVVKEPQEVRSWIFCDGDIDPEWVESLNSVLDDNKLLTMPNGVRIQFGSNVNFVFETHSLEFASPATVSRMGIIFLSEQDVHPKYTVASFMTRLTDERRAVVEPFINEYLYPAIDALVGMNSLAVGTTRMGLLTAALNHVTEATNKFDFACCLVRGLGSILKAESQAAYASKVFALCGEAPEDAEKPLNSYFNREKNKKASFSSRNIAKLAPTDLQPVDKPMVRTVEVERLMTVLDPLAKDPACKPFFLVGPDGCGKSMILRNCFIGASEKGVNVSVIHCSAQTSAQHVIQKITQLCAMYSTNSGKVLRPKEGDRLVICLKDVNLPKPDRYGTVQLHSFIQQLLLYQGYYDSELEWVGIEKVQIVASMNPVISAGRFPVAPRLLAIVNIVCLPYPSKESLTQVYTTFFGALLRSPQLATGPQYDNGQQLAAVATTVFDTIKSKFEGEEYAHCVFSPRDITQWACSLQNYSVEGTDVASLLYYEACRIFVDRLAKHDDRSRAEKIILEQLSTIGFNGGREKDDKEKPYFASWQTEWPANTAAPKLLKLTQYADVEKEVKAAMGKFRHEFRDLSIPPISEILAWIPRLDRVLAQPNGHTLLVGRTGVGRRSAVTIASYMLRMSVAAINMTRDYTLKMFRTDLRAILQRAAAQNERITLVIEDHNFTQEAFLEMINSLISSGEVPGLFNPEELEQMMAPLREEASNEGFIGNMHSFFLQRIAKNLRVSVIMDPRNPLFAPRCQANPGLITCCAVLWFGSWSSDTTKSVCKYTLRKIIKEIEGDSNFKGFTLHRDMLWIHETQGDRVTPQQFQTLMATYESIFNSKGKASGDALARLEAGLAKLKEAERDVDKIKSEVGVKKVDLERKQAEGNVSMEKIQVNLSDSAEQREQAAVLEEQLKKEAKEIDIKKEKAEAELASCQPILDAAKEAIGNVDPKALNEIASLPKPPETIVAILEGVLGLFGIADSAWGSMKKFLTERGVKERIQNFDAKGLSPAIRSSVSKIISQKGDCFKPEVAMRASKAAAPLAAWVKANVEYATVLERIGPLTTQLAQLEASQKKGEADLAGLKKQLETIDKNVEKLRKDFGKNCKEAERLKEGLEKAEAQLETAQSLLEKLTGEKVRWSSDAVVIKEKNKQMPRRALLCAAFLTYLAKFPEDQRAHWLRMWSDKLGFPTTPLVTEFMRNESQLLQYKSEGLPADNLSQENAVAILDAIQTPLIVDPANQAVEWLKTNLKNRDVTTEVTSIADDRFAHTLELAIRFGKTLLVTEVDKIDAMLYPVLRRDLNTAGPKYVVQLGNKQVDWQDSFKIVLFSRSASLQLTSDSTSLVTEVNFSVTRSGLESQLLGITIQKENPELETQKVELLQQEDALQMQLAKLEESLLADLANSSGDLLQNTQLIDSLNLIKTQAQTIGESLKRSKELQVELDQKREVYRPFAKNGSTVFFLIKDLNTLNRMYEFSLSAFLDHFKSTLADYQQGSEDIVAKIQALSLGMAQRAFLSVSLGLFKADRIEFAMHVVHNFFPDRFPKKHWEAFTGSLVGDEERAAQRLPSWAFASSKVAFSSVLALEDGEALIEKWKLGDGSFWESWMKDPTPEKLLISRRGDLSDMDRLLIVGAFRRDRLVALMTYVALTNLNIPSLAEVTTVEAFVSTSKAEVPLLLITSSGADPSIEVQEIAHKTVGKARFTQIALGGGQTDEAMMQLRRCAANGDWIFLKNLHLVLDWVTILEKEVSAMAQPHPDFRLFMTTEAHDLFPTVLLQSCDKMTIEAPPGVKQNLLRSYSTWTEDFLAKLTPQQSQILFGLAWFHAIVQERRTYIPQGWVKFYEFTQADLKSASDIVLMMSGANNKNTCDWVAIQGLFESAIYGGRLDNDQDNKVLSVFLRKIFNENVLINCSQPLSQIADIPRTNSHDAIVKHIFGKVPDVDAPTTFMLPPNADRAVQESTATKNLQDLRLLSNVSSADSGASAEALKGILDPILAMWESAGLKADPNAVPTIPPEVANPGPMQVFFVSEIALLTNLINRLTRRFNELKKVRDGVIIPTDDLRLMATTLSTGSCPEVWLDWMTGPSSASLWLQLLKRRYEAVQQAFAKLSSNELMTSKIKLTEFLRPHTFLNALRQHTARQSGEPMVQLVLACYPAASSAARKSAVPVMLDGSVMALQGATCQGDRLGAVDNNAPSSSRFVDLTVGWIKSDAFTEEGFVQLPVYLSQERELHLMNVQMPCGNAAEKDSWILSGAAIFLTP